MALYLHMDGVDDSITIPFINAPRYEIVLRVKELPDRHRWLFSRVWGGVRYNTSGNTFSTSVQNNSIRVVETNELLPGSSTLPLNEKLLFVGTFTGENAVTYIGRYINSDPRASFDFFDAKFYNGDTLIAHYDMSTGTVNDISGNGNHATLTGGTWIDEGQGGGTEPEPTPISIQFPTRQTIFKQTSFEVNTNQSIYKTILESHSTKQAIYKQTNISHLTTQQIYKQIAEQFSTEQSVFKQVSYDFPMEIIITALTNYVASFPTEQIIYKQIVSDNPTKQAVYKPIAESAPMQQSIFKQVSSEFKTAQQIFKSVISDAAIQQVIYKHVSEDVPLQIRVIIPGAPELVGIIKLQGKRELLISLQGGLKMLRNQNFSMVSGDSKTLEIDIKENLTGVTVKWAMKKRGEPTVTLTKIGSIVDGKIHIILDKVDTEELSGLFVHECEVTDQNGNVSTVTTGSVNILTDMI